MLRWSTLNVDRHFHTKVWHVRLSAPLNWIYKEGEGIVVSFRNTRRRKERAGLQMEKAALLWSWLKTVTEIKRKDSICMKNIVQCKIYPGVCLFLQLSALNASGIFEGLVTIKAAHHCQQFFIIYLYREYVSSRSFSTQLMGSFVLAVGLWLRFDPETVSLLSGDKAPDTFFIGEHHSAPSLIFTAKSGTL